LHDACFSPSSFFLKGGEGKNPSLHIARKTKDSSMTFQQRRQFFDQRDKHGHKNENDPFFFLFFIFTSSYIYYIIISTVINYENNSDRAHTNTLHKGIFSFFSKGTPQQQQKRQINTWGVPQRRRRRKSKVEKKKELERKKEKVEHSCHQRQWFARVSHANLHPQFQSSPSPPIFPSIFYLILPPHTLFFFSSFSHMQRILLQILADYWHIYIYNIYTHTEKSTIRSF